MRFNTSAFASAPVCTTTTSKLLPPVVGELDADDAALDQLLFDSFTGRLVEASGDALRRLRHNPNTGETRRHALRCPEMISNGNLVFVPE